MELIIIFILIILNGFFTMSELAIISSKSYKLEDLYRSGNRNAKLALKLKNSPDRFLSTAQMGITLIGILTGIFSGQKITDDFIAFIKTVPYINSYAEQIGVVGVIFIVTLASIIFGELIPKRLGLIYPEKLSLVVAKPINFISIITKPFIWLLTIISNKLMNFFGLKEEKRVFITESEIKAMVRSSVDFGDVETIEGDIVNRTFLLGDRTVEEIMTYRTDIIEITLSDTIEDIRNIVKNDPHTFYPVTKEDNLDKIIGVLNIKDVFSSDILDIESLMKPIIYVPETSAVFDLLEKFKKEKTNFAIVVDEYGGTRGLITLSDVIDALVGDIANNEDEYEITKSGDNEWLVDGQYPFYQLLNYFNIEEDEDMDYNTIGGLILDVLSSIPKVGEKIEWKNYEITVVDMDGNRIDKVLIKLNEAEKEEQHL